MTTAEKVPVWTGFCNVGRHQTCRGGVNGHPCPCPCHQEPELPPKPDHRIVTRHKPATATLPFGLDTDVPIDPDPLEPHPEHPTPIELVVRLTQSERVTRANRLTQMSWNRFDQAIDSLKPRYVNGKWTPNKSVAGICSLVSGGNDSYTLAHIFRSVATHHVHANTGTGIEATRQFVRIQAGQWDVPLIEKHVKPGKGYFDLVRGTVTGRNRKTGEIVKVWAGGFPGPAVHGLMQQRLKGHQLEQIPHDFGISGSQTERVVYLAGRRRPESKVRATVPHFEEKGTVLWSSPLAIWHKADLRAYRLIHADTDNPVPVNPVSMILGMSGECGCCSNAVAGERELWFNAYPHDPFILAVQAMEEELKPRTDIPEHRKIWGWGGTDEGRAAEAAYMEAQNRKAEPAPALVEVDGILCSVNCGTDPLFDLMDPLHEENAA